MMTPRHDGIVELRWIFFLLGGWFLLEVMVSYAEHREMTVFQQQVLDQRLHAAFGYFAVFAVISAIAANSRKVHEMTLTLRDQMSSLLPTVPVLAEAENAAKAVRNQRRAEQRRLEREQIEKDREASAVRHRELWTSIPDWAKMVLVGLIIGLLVCIPIYAWMR